MKRSRKNTNELTEPFSTKEISGYDLLHSYNFYRSHFTEKDAKTFLMDYTSSKDKKAIINSLSHIPLYYCWTARMIQNGNKLPSENVEKLNNFINNLKKEERTKKVNVIDFSVSAEKRNENKIYDAYAFLETLIDKLFDSKGKQEISAESVIVTFDLNKSQAASIAEMLEDDHIKDFRKISTDTEIQEGYAFLTKKQQNLVFKILKTVKQEFLSLKTVSSSTTKKKRAVRLKSISEQIKNIKFKDKVFQTPSIDLKHLVGKRVIYIASDDKRSLFRLESKSGFEIRSSFLTNVDEIQKLIVYGKNLEVAVSYLASAKNETVAKKIKQNVQIRRFDNIEVKNNEYRTTDKFCVIQGYLDL